MANTAFLFAATALAEIIGCYTGLASRPLFPLPDAPGSTGGVLRWLLHQPRLAPPLPAPMGLSHSERKVLSLEAPTQTLP